MVTKMVEVLSIVGILSAALPTVKSSDPPHEPDSGLLMLGALSLSESAGIPDRCDRHC